MYQSIHTHRGGFNYGPLQPSGIELITDSTSATAAAREYNVAQCTIINACKAQQRSCGSFWLIADTVPPLEQRKQIIERLHKQMQQRIDYNNQNRSLLAKQKCGHKIRIIETGETFDSIKDMCTIKRWSPALLYELIACGLPYDQLHFEYVVPPSKHVKTRQTVVNVTNGIVH